MSKPIAYYNPEYKMIVEDTTHPHLYLPLFAIDDETREAIAIAITCIQQLERMSREIDNTPGTLKGDPIMRHIGPLERLRGTSG